MKKRNMIKCITCKKAMALGLIVASAATLAACSGGNAVRPEAAYAEAMTLKENGDYEGAFEAFLAIADYEDAYDQAVACDQKIEYLRAEAYLAENDYENAETLYTLLGEYEDSTDKIDQIHTSMNQEIYDSAVAEWEDGEFDSAIEIFESLGDFSDAADQMNKVKDDKLQSGIDMVTDGDYEDAYNLFIEMGDYSDSADQALKAAKLLADEYLADEKYEDAVDWYVLAGEEDLVSDTKFTYVSEKGDAKDSLTYQYLSDLVDAEYEGAAELYEEWFAEELTVFANNSLTDEETVMNSFTRTDADSVYMHALHTGGDPEAEYEYAYKHYIMTKSTDKWALQDDGTVVLLPKDDGARYSARLGNNYAHVIKQRVVLYDVDTEEIVAELIVDVNK